VFLSKVFNVFNNSSIFVVVEICMRSAVVQMDQRGGIKPLGMPNRKHWQWRLYATK